MAVRRPGAATTQWRRSLEWLLFASPAAAGACLVGLGLTAPRLDVPALQTTAAVALERPAFAVVALVALTLVGLVWSIGLAAALYLDAESLREETGGWDPPGAAYAALVLVLPLAALHYLRRRHRHVEPAPGAGRWWLAFPLAALAPVLAFAAVRQGALPPVAVLAGQGLGLAVLPVAAYRDAVRVRAVDAGWRPDPALHFALAVLAALLVLPLPIYVGYYLLRRAAASDR